MKYLEINIAKEAKALYTENYKTVMKRVEEHTNKYISCTHGLEELIL